MPVYDSFTRRSAAQSFDWKLVGLYLALVLIGWVCIYAAVYTPEMKSPLEWASFSGKQAVWILSSLALASVIMFLIPKGWWESGSGVLYGLVVFLLVAVIFAGTATKGSHSWFKFGAVSFQPAEISKITTSLLLAYVMSSSNFHISRPKDFITAGAIIALPMLIILAENETGSALVYVGLIFMLYREGLSGWFIALIGLAILLFVLTLKFSGFVSLVVLAGLALVVNAGMSRDLLRNIGLSVLVIVLLALIPAVQRLVGGPAGSIDPEYILLGLMVPAVAGLAVPAYRKRNVFLRYTLLTVAAGAALVFSTQMLFDKVMQPHQKDRIEVLLGIKEDIAGAGYNVHQSMIAIGSGGLTGKGFLQGTQTKYGFVPEQHTDFIFCTVGEEWGFVGCLVVILLYVFMIWRIIIDAEHSREAFTRIYGYCVAGCLFMHLFINIGMTVGLVPVIGIPLPFVSYGGSSLWAFTIMLFIFIALDHEEKKYF